jgi:hypothetical protein
LAPNATVYQEEILHADGFKIPMVVSIESLSLGSAAIIIQNLTNRLRSLILLAPLTENEI